ncbi:MAG: putative metal-binding motif-containing protein, partial [Myxococcota bacterium]|nr:putative metal-binding motif-containing protein [Myxococcota bacterium]
DGYPLGEDCDDTDAAVNPGVNEDCETVHDDNCDGETNSWDADHCSAFYQDRDLDGYGDTDVGSFCACEPKGYYIEPNPGDCDDTDADVHPDAEELRGDGIDNDCDATTVDDRFSVSSVDASCACGAMSTAGVDSAGNLMVAYFNATTGSIRYNTRSAAGTWAGAQNTGITSISGEWLHGVYDSSDDFHLGFTVYDTTATELHYIAYSSSSWGTQYIVEDYALAQSYDVGYFVSVDVDSSDLPRFAYFDNTFGAPMLSEMMSSTKADYSALELSSYGTDGYYTSLAVDSSDAAHVAYYDGEDDEVTYRLLDSSLTEVVASGGIETALALKSDDTPCITWYDYVGGDLEYACRTGTDTWATQTVDTTGYVGDYPALTFNTSDEPYIAYYDYTNGDLKVAHHDGASWSTLTVDATGNVGQQPAITIDRSDVVYISYYDFTNATVKLAEGY